MKKFNKVVLTGGAGFVGSHLAEKLNKNLNFNKLIILDKLTYAASLKNLSNIKNLNFEKIDICNFNKCLKITKNCDLLINVAAESHVDNSFGNSLNFTKTNTVGTHNLMECARLNNIKKIIHMSTDEVFGDEIISKNYNIFNPTNPYSASKAAAEMIINSFKKSYRLPITIIRSNNIYGTRQYPEKLIPKLIVSILLNKKFPLHGKGKNLRNFVSIKDVTEIFMNIISSKIYIEEHNIISNQEYSNLSIVKMIAKKMNKDVGKVYKAIKDRPFNDKKYHLSNKKNVILFKPKFKLELEIVEIIDWYKKNLTRFNNLSFR